LKFVKSKSGIRLIINNKTIPDITGKSLIYVSRHIFRLTALFCLSIAYLQQEHDIRTLAEKMIMFTHRGYILIWGSLIVFLCLLCVGTPLFAAEPQNKTGQKSYFEMSLEELMEVQITTGASRPMNRDKMPSSVTVITADEIKLLGLRNLTDVINYIVPGGIGDIHRSTRTGLYCFRGITADDNGKFVFMVDGLNVTSMTMWGAFNERYLGLLDELDRIEITQGVSSNLYGDGATSGIINFITKTGKDFQGTQITSGYGSGNDFQESIKFGSKKSETENDFYYFGYKQSHGYTPSGGSGSSTTGEGRKEHSADGRYWNHFPPSFKFQSTVQRGEFTLRARYVQDKFEEPYTASGFDYWNTSDVYWFHNYFFIQPEILHVLNENSRIKANIALEMEEMGQQKFKDWYASAGGNLIAEAGEDYITRGERKIRGQLLHYYDGFANHKLTTGAELFWMHVGPDFSGENRTITVVSGNRVDVENIEPKDLYFGALLAEDIWQLSERTTLFAGARLEKHNLTSASFSPRITISHDVSEKTNVKFLYNSGYRTPPWGYFASNEKNSKPEPKPEKVQSFEAHILHKFNPKFNTSLIGYYTTYKNLINYWSSSAPFSGNSSYYNFPEVKVAGLEGLGEYHSENLTLKVSHSYSRPVHLSDNAWRISILSYNEDDWAQFPTHLTKAQAIIPLIKDKCTLGLTYLRPWGIRGQRNADPKLKDAADYINATLTFKLNKNFELQVSGYNLTSEAHPWWGAYTYDGVSRDINPNPTYFIRLIGTF